jgi:GTP-binding protein HflX
LLHVVDASSPAAAEQTAHVLATLNEIGAAHTPQILVLNKVDLIADQPDTSALARRILGDPEHQPAGAVGISAFTGEGFDRLLTKIDETLALDPVSPCVFRFPLGEGGPLHLLHEHARVTSKTYEDDACIVEATVPASIRRRLVDYLVESGE